MIDWRVEARARGWPPGDIAALASVLAVGDVAGTRVVSVGANAIVLETDVRLDFGARVVVQVRAWRWHRTDEPTSSVVARAATTTTLGCIRHGRACGADAGGCGLRDLAERDVCGCPSRFDPTAPSCSRVVHAADCPCGNARVVVVPKPAYVAPPVYAPVAKAPKRKKGAPLPGQQGLFGK